jgi:hypothetical protein
MADETNVDGYNLRKHRDASVAKLTVLWKELVPLIITSYTSPQKIRATVAEYFGPPPWDFLDGDRRLVPAVLWQEAPLVAIKSADYEFDHPGPNHFGLRVDFSEIPGLRAGGYYQFELPVGGRFVRQLESTFANNIYLKGFANLRVIYGRTIRNNSLAQVARIRKDDSLLLEDWRGAEKKDKRPLVKALVMQVHNPPTTGQLYLVVSFANPVAEKA